MDKPFGFWHKGAILNLQGCKDILLFKYVIVILHIFLFLTAIFLVPLRGV